MKNSKSCYLLALASLLGAITLLGCSDDDHSFEAVAEDLCVQRQECFPSAFERDYGEDLDKCTENAVEHLQNGADSYPDECSKAYLKTQECFSELNCDEMEDYEDGGDTSKCQDELDELEECSKNADL